MTYLIALAIILVLVGAVAVLLDQRQSGEKRWGAVRPRKVVPFWLEVRAGPHEGEWLALARDPLTIGSAPSNILGVEDRMVGYRHAVIYPFQDGWMVRDTGEGNVTTVNEMPLRRGSVRLRPGDTICIGPLRLMAHISAPPTGTPVRAVGSDMLAAETAAGPTLRPTPAPTLNQDGPLFASAREGSEGSGRVHGGSKWRRAPTREELKRVVTFLEEEGSDEAEYDTDNGTARPES